MIGNSTQRALVLKPSLLLMFLAGALVCASIPARAKERKTETFFNVLKELDSGELARIRSLLLSIESECPKLEQKCPSVVALQDTLAGGFLSEHLPVLFVYLDDDFEVKVNRLVWRKKVTPFVFGAQNVWVALLSERPIDLQADLTFLWGHQDKMVKGVRDVFISDGKRAIEDEGGRTFTKPLTLEQLSPDNGADQLLIGLARFAVKKNAAYRIAITPANDEAKETANFKQIQASFTNSPDSSIDFGIAAGLTYDVADPRDAKPPTNDDIGGIRRDNYVIGAHWMVNIYFRRPTLIKPIVHKTGSRYRTSYAVAVGFNLNVFDIDQLILGLNIGHLFGRNGMVIGANFIDPLDSDRELRETRPYVGVNFNF